MVASNGKLALVMVVVGMTGGIWSLARTTPLDPYQQLVDAVAAGRPVKPLAGNCAALGPLSPAMREALRCPELSSGR